MELEEIERRGKEIIARGRERAGRERSREAVHTGCTGELNGNGILATRNRNRMMGINVKRYA